MSSFDSDHILAKLFRRLLEPTEDDISTDMGRRFGDVTGQLGRWWVDGNHDLPIRFLFDTCTKVNRDEIELLVALTCTGIASWGRQNEAVGFALAVRHERVDREESANPQEGTRAASGPLERRTPLVET